VGRAPDKLDAASAFVKDATDRDAELSVCDAILELRTEQRAGRRRRLLEVAKARGAAPPEGAHPFRIMADGLAVYPRWESVVSIDPDAPWKLPRDATSTGGGRVEIAGGEDGHTKGTLQLPSATAATVVCHRQPLQRPSRSAAWLTAT
jgi:hypothetical protein